LVFVQANLGCFLIIHQSFNIQDRFFLVILKETCGDSMRLKSI
jgi:hypothetical protein